MSIAEILGPDGGIARRLTNYESRPQQLAMAEAVAEAIAAPRHLMVEAGTGVGKSFAYLVPAIQAAIAGGKEHRVVISTHTISLQEQLIKKDIPFLKSVLPSEFSAVLVKGRSNYISLRRLRGAQQRAGMLLADPTAARQLLHIGRWSRQTTDGSRSDLDFQPQPAVWDLVESDSGNCLGRQCPDNARCFYFKARKQMFGAHVLVVNHALFFSDLALRRSGASMLPDYRTVIFDEAHTLEDVASEHMGLQLGRGSIDSLLNKLYNPRSQRGLLSSFGSVEAVRQVSATRNTAELFFNSIQSWCSRQPRPGRSTGGLTPPARHASESLRVREPGIVPDPLSEELVKLASRVVEETKDLEEEVRIEYTAIADRCLGLAQGLRQWLKQELPGQVYWVDMGGEQGQRVALASAPIDVGPVLNEFLFSRVPSIVLTSATLSVGGKNGFDFFRERLGVGDCATLQLGSPFNYREQAELHLFRDMPDPPSNPPDYDEAVIARISEYVRRTKGRAFVLFTSSQTMTRAADRLRRSFASEGLTLLSQGDGLPRMQMLDRFRTTPGAVLFGVDSFWQGVDVPGEALCNVIITKLPFVAPDRPILAARQEAIQEAGGQPFTEYQVPQAVIKLKQGFGRLIRTVTDHGMVVILDPRVLTKGYGRSFLQALPECRRFVDGVEQPAAPS
jgi:ATP-dependent DNA helicase DinG